MSIFDRDIIENLDRIKCQYEFLIKSYSNDKSEEYDFGKLYLLESIDKELDNIKKQILNLYKELNQS